MTDLQTKKKQQLKIDADVAAFLKRGGKITHLSNKDSGLDRELSFIKRRMKGAGVDWEKYK